MAPKRPPVLGAAVVAEVLVPPKSPPVGGLAAGVVVEGAAPNNPPPVEGVVVEGFAVDEAVPGVEVLVAPVPNILLPPVKFGTGLRLFCMLNSPFPPVAAVEGVVLVPEEAGVAEFPPPNKLPPVCGVEVAAPPKILPVAGAVRWFMSRCLISDLAK